MDVESAPAPLPSPSAESAARLPGTDCSQSPLLGRPPRSPAPLHSLPLVVPDLNPLAGALFDALALFDQLLYLTIVKIIEDHGF